MEKFFVMGCGSLVLGLGMKLSYDMPAGNFLFVPMGLVGSTTAFLGLIKAVPWFHKKFPDIMYMLHQAQIILCITLGVMFVLFVQLARRAGEFVDNNWEGCEYPVCTIPPGSKDPWWGNADFSLSNWADKQGMSKEDLKALVQPLFYSAGIANMATCLTILGGSNLAKILYYRDVCSRKEETIALQSGQGQAEVRKSALVKKVRRVREADIKEVQAEMQNSGIVHLEEDALMMEFATAIPMEEHYDLIAHDDLIAQLGDAADTEKLAGDASRGVASLGGIGAGLGAAIGATGFMEDDPDMDFTSNAGLDKLKDTAADLNLEDKVGGLQAKAGDLQGKLPDAAALQGELAGKIPAGLPAGLPASMPDVGALKAKAMEAAQKAMDEATAKQAEAQAALDGAKKKKDKKAAEEALAEKTAMVEEAKAALAKIQAGELPAGIPGMPAGMDPAALQAQLQGKIPEGMDPAAFQAQLAGMDPAALQAQFAGQIPEGMDPAAFQAQLAGMDPAALQAQLQGQIPEGMDPAAFQAQLAGMDPAALQAQFAGQIPEGMDPAAFQAQLAGMDPAALQAQFAGKIPGGMDPSKMMAGAAAGGLVGGRAGGISKDLLKSDEFVSKRGKDDGTGVRETGSSLANLARQLQNSGIVHDDTIHDERAGDPLPLDIRLQGAKQLMSKTKFNNAGWHNMNIFTKRDAMYQTMHEDNAETGQMDEIMGMLPSAKLNKLFSKRL
jgi:hypothetical protein